MRCISLMLFFVRTFKFIAFSVFFAFSIVVIAADQGGNASTESLIERVLPEVEGTDLGKNLKLLEDYYQKVNEKLNNKLKGGARDPFQQLVLPPERKAESESPRFFSGQSGVAKKSTRASSSKPVVMRSVRGRSAMLPAMQFRGFMRVGGVSAALLDIVGIGSVIVKVGDKVGMGRMDAEDETVIRIVEINTLNVTVEVGSLGERVVVQ